MLQPGDRWLLQGGCANTTCGKQGRRWPGATGTSRTRSWLPRCVFCWVLPRSIPGGSCFQALEVQQTNAGAALLGESASLLPSAVRGKPERLLSCLIKVLKVFIQFSSILLIQIFKGFIQLAKPSWYLVLKALEKLCLHQERFPCSPGCPWLMVIAYCAAENWEQMKQKGFCVTSRISWCSGWV